MSPFTQVLMPFEETNGFEKLIIDYLNDSKFLLQFYQFDDTLQGIQSRIETYQNNRLNRENLKEVLLKQYISYGIDEIPQKVHKNILSLVHPDTFTVTSGHQLNIFSGPLYVIYKLISTINLAEKLNTHFPDKHFVPVYWMATEDHDINEITSINLFGKNYKWESQWKGIAGKMPLNGIEAVISELKLIFGNSVFGDELISIMTTSYLDSTLLSEATRKWINKLLGKSGLVVIDGNDASFKKTIHDILSDELINKTSSTIINKTTQNLGKKYQSQANPREINLFYIGDDFRERLVIENDGIKVLNTDIFFSMDRIKEELISNPEKFSPNVVLRPLYQESILPNVVFVGGPSEISYWLELKDLFEYHNVPLPVLFLRCSSMILDKNMLNKLDKLSIKEKDTFLTVDELIKTFIHTKEKDQPTFHNVIKVISDEFIRLSNSVSTVDPTLRAAVESESIKVLASLHLLEDKIMRSLKKKNETEINQIRKIKGKLFPSGKFQEREDSMISFYLNWGSEFIESLKKNLDPLQKEFIILKEL